jgi:hypothetical protein
VNKKAARKGGLLKLENRLATLDLDQQTTASIDAAAEVNRLRKELLKEPPSSGVGDDNSVEVVHKKVKKKKKVVGDDVQSKPKKTKKKKITTDKSEAPRQVAPSGPAAPTN